MKQKVLTFNHRQHTYQILPDGHMRLSREGGFQQRRLFLGGSPHKLDNKVLVSLREAFEYPERLNGCLMWCKTEGKVVQYVSQFNGGIAKIENCKVVKLKI